jgi:outer membrane protein
MKKNILPLLPLSACLLLPSLAMAQEPSQENQLVLGGGVAGGPRYAGSNHNMLAPMLVVDYSHHSGVFASTLRGLGYGGQVGPISYSAALGYRRGREDHDNENSWASTGGDELRGMGDIKGNASGIVSVGYAPIPGLEYNVGADLPLSQRQNGRKLTAGVTGRLLGTPDDKITLGVATSFGDTKFNQTYYGVTREQARTSQFEAYTMKAGLNEVAAMLTWQHKLGAKWSVTSMVGATTLLKDASKSPLVQRRTGPVAAVYASYNY